MKRISCQQAACFGLLLGVTSWLYGNPLTEGLATPAEPSLALAGVPTEPTTLFHGTIPSLRIHISDSEFAKLVQDLRQYVKATVTEGENVYTDVGIHAKGGLGSFRPLDRNPSLTLNFDKFRKGQLFYGMDKIHLNNSVQDATFMTENITRGLFRVAGVPVTRAGHARVTFNGRDVGLYVVVEGVDKQALRRFFKDPRGNLYEGGMRKDVGDTLRKTSGNDPEDRADLKLLGEALSDSNLASRTSRLKSIVDLEAFVSFMAMEVLVVHWDGYCVRPNNYRIYHDPGVGRMTFLPHGMDQMFWEPSAPILPIFDGLVAKFVVDAPELRSHYVERVSSLLTNAFRVRDLTNRINELNAKVRPVIYDFNPEMVGQYDVAVALLKERIVYRAVSVAAQLEAFYNPLNFASKAACRIYGWEPRNESKNASVEHTTAPDGKDILRIASSPGGPGDASWRTKHMIRAGRYVMEGRVRTKGVMPLTDGRGEGAGIRISGAPAVRLNKATGDTPWKTLTYDFVVDRDRLVEFVCELRATTGEAWFDPASLKIRRSD